MQCAAHAPHSPSNPSPTGSLIGKALALQDNVCKSPSATRREHRKAPRGSYIRRAAGASYATIMEGVALRDVGMGRKRLTKTTYVV